MNITRPAAAAALIAASLLLSGCGSLIPSPEQIIGDTVENAVEDATGTTVDVGGNASLPDSWPGLPTPNGDLTSSFSADNTYSLTYRLPDDTAVDAFKDELLAEGYELTSEMSGELGIYVMESDEWVLSLSWYEVEGEGVYLSYGAAAKES